MTTAAIRSVLDPLNARWVAPPVLQPAGLYLELAGEDIRRRAYMIQSEDGAELCLRPDMTVPVCRFALREGLTPSLLAYEGMVFRQQDDDSEFVQIGAEWCGFDGDRAEIDATVVSVALAAARAAGVEPTLRMGDVALVLASASACGWSPAWVARLARAFRRPGGLKRVFEDAAHVSANSPAAALAEEVSGLSRAEAEQRVAARLAQAGVALVGARTVADIADRLSAIGREAAAEHPGPAAVERLRAIVAVDDAPAVALEKIAALLVASPAPHHADAALRVARDRLSRIVDVAPKQAFFSPGFGRGLAYYDGLVFELEASAHGAQVSLGGGGRYDGLLADLAADPHAKPTNSALTAAGFAVRPARLHAAAAT